MRPFFERLLSALDVLERAAMAVAMVMMLMVMAIVAADVFMRYVFNSPFSWAYDLISLYLMAGIFFFAVSQAYGAGVHVNVDILQQVFPDWLKRVCECLINGTGFVVFALMVDFSLHRAIDAYQSGDVLAGAVNWPTWLSIALVPFGAGLLCLRLAVQFLGHLASLLTGRDLIPVSSGAHEAGEVFE